MTLLRRAVREELATLRDRVNEAIAEGSPAVVKSLLQALIHEIGEVFTFGADQEWLIRLMASSTR